MDFQHRRLRSNHQSPALHRRDLSGFLAANVGPFLVEFSDKERWDAAIPRSAVFVHRFEDNHSYIMAGKNGNYDLAVGDIFEQGDPNNQYQTYSSVDVIAIDNNLQTATLRLKHRSRVPFPIFELIGRLVSGVAYDGGGVIFIGGQSHPVPPRGPESVILQSLVDYLAVQEMSNIALRSQVQRQALASISKAVAARTAQLLLIRTPQVSRPGELGAEN